MANESRARQSRPPTSPQNSATMGVILVVAAVVIAILLFNAGGGVSTETSDETPAEAAKGDTTTTTTIAVQTTTPLADLAVVVGNGTGVTGKAKTASEKLAAIGYTNISYVGSAAVANTLVYYSPNYELDATALAAAMKLPGDRVQPVPATTTLEEPVLAAVIVIIGPDVDPESAEFATPATN